MSGIETALLIAGTAISAVGQLKAGADQEASLNAQASARERQANENRAVAQREAGMRKKNAEQVLSRQLAVAAASGGGAADKTVLDIMGDTEAEGDFQAKAALYEGETQGRNLDYQAGIDRMEARNARLSSFINAGSTVLSGAGYGVRRRQTHQTQNRTADLRYG